MKIEYYAKIKKQFKNFFIATEEAADREKFDGARELALAEQAAASELGAEDDDAETETQLSRQQLEGVYNFCALLPTLQQQRMMPPNAHAR